MAKSGLVTGDLSSKNASEKLRQNRRSLCRILRTNARDLSFQATYEDTDFFKIDQLLWSSQRAHAVGQINKDQSNLATSGIHTNWEFRLQIFSFLRETEAPL